MAAAIDQLVRAELDELRGLRDGSAWEAIIARVRALPPELGAAPAIRCHLGFALNRAGRFDEAEALLTDLVHTAGIGRADQSKAYGILGRVYKDRWQAERRHHPKLADEFLDRAIDAYQKGFAADESNPYAGVNAVTLMTIRDRMDPSIRDLFAKVRTSAEHKRALTSPVDYFDVAALLELAVVGLDEPQARSLVEQAANLATARWKVETTANNLQLLRSAREEIHMSPAWARDAEQALIQKADTLGPALAR